MFEGVALRTILADFSKKCRVGWICEPLPAEEVKYRVANWGGDFYPEGKNIEARGGDWYQLHCLPAPADNVVNGVVK